jgi:GntR family transcriptional regulator / MocR family aminotransferase
MHHGNQMSGKTSQTVRPRGDGRPPRKKARKRSIIAFEMIRLDRAAAEPIQEQLYQQIRAELETGSFGNGSWRLPSSRTLAADLGISRFTVKLALERLRIEGYLYSTVGSGTFIAEIPPEHFLRARHAEAYPATGSSVQVSKRVEQLPDKRSGKDLDVGIAGPPGRILVPGIPAVDEFPLSTWERLRTQILARKGAHLLRYAPSRGELDLRKAIAAYLCDFRGVRCGPDQVVVVSGMQQAMMVSGLALVNPGEAVWVEDPGYRQAHNVFGFAGATLVPRPLDHEGLVIDRSSRRPGPRIIFVTPSAELPLGMTMSAKRRKDLIDFARTRNAIIFEDDYNSEFWFGGPPMPSLQGMDDSGHVIYAGTMSKILYPSLRLGFLVVPERLIEPIIKTRSVMDQHSSPIDQVTLARFITEGFFLSHVRRIRQIYAERRAFFVEQFNSLFKEHFRLDVPGAGLHLVAWLRNPEDFPPIYRYSQSSQIAPVRLSAYCIKANLNPAFVFGFAAWTKAQIRESLFKLATVLTGKASEVVGSR